MLILDNIGVFGLLALAFAIGFGAGWWTAIGTAWLLVRFILFSISDRHPIPHSNEDENNAHNVDNLIPVMPWPSTWRWPVRRKNIRNTESRRESPSADQEASP